METTLFCTLLCLPAVASVGYPNPSQPWVAPQHFTSWQPPQTRKYNPAPQYRHPPQIHQNNQAPQYRQPPQTQQNNRASQYRHPPQTQQNNRASQYRQPPQTQQNKQTSPYGQPVPRGYPQVPQYYEAPQPQPQQYPYGNGQQRITYPPQNGGQYQYRPTPPWGYPPQNRMTPPPFPPMPMPWNQHTVNPQLNLMSSALNFLEGLDLPHAMEQALTSKYIQVAQYDPSAALTQLMSSLQSMSTPHALMAGMGGFNSHMPPPKRPYASQYGMSNVPVIGKALTG